MYIKQKISEENVKNILFRKKSFFLFKKKRIPLKKIELIYIPYYLIEIILTGKNSDQKALVAVDGLMGNLSFFNHDNAEYIEKTDAPACNFILQTEDARKIAQDEIKWHLLEIDMRTRRKSFVKEVGEIREIFYPFLICYFKKGNSYDFKAVDAISGAVQGIKMRKVFLKALKCLT